MAKIEREKTINFEYQSEMRDVGLYRGKFTLKRRTPAIVTDIKLGKARMLAGNRPANTGDDLHFEIMATLANAIEPVPNSGPDSTAWIEDLLDPAIWHALYIAWQEYQASFSEPKAEGDAGQAAV